jgi:hypothetical protein
MMTKWGMVTFWHERRRTEACRDDGHDHILTTGSMAWMQGYGDTLVSRRSGKTASCGGVRTWR